MRSRTAPSILYTGIPAALPRMSQTAISVTGHSELRDALHALVFERTPQIGADPLGKRRVLPDQDGLDLVFQDGLHDARRAGDHAEVACSPSR